MMQVKVSRHKYNSRGINWQNHVKKKPCEKLRRKKIGITAKNEIRHSLQGLGHVQKKVLLSFQLPD